MLGGELQELGAVNVTPAMPWRSGWPFCTLLLEDPALWSQSLPRLDALLVCLEENLKDGLVKIPGKEN